MDRKLIIGIDASSSVDGGSQTHLIEIIDNMTDVILDRIDVIIVFGSRNTLNLIKNYCYIFKINNWFLNSNFIIKKIWINFFLYYELRKYNCDILLDISGTYLGKFTPYVGMSRNMLIYENNEVNRFNNIFQNIRFFILRIMQINSFKNSNGIIFISHYAKDKILRFFKKKLNWVIIHHGISKKFFDLNKIQYKSDFYNKSNKFKLLYVSNLLPFKHQINLIKAVIELNELSIPIHLDLYGGHTMSKYGRLVLELIKNSGNENVKFLGKLPYDEIIKAYHNSDCFIFASTCENMPNILIEAMASGLPVICSNFGPMPEFGDDAVIYFNPTDVNSIKFAILRVFNDSKLREEMILKNKKIVKKFSWEKSSLELFNFLIKSRVL